MPFINCTGKDWKIAVHDVEEFCSSLDVPQITGTPKVSIIIPCFNSGRFLLDAIESCAHQSYRDFEIIVVNDGSTDRTKTIAKCDMHREVALEDPVSPCIEHTDRAVAPIRQWRKIIAPLH